MSSEALLTDNLKKLNKLIEEDNEIIKKKMSVDDEDEDYDDENETEELKNTVEITDIMLWIATNHPELLKDKAEKFQSISIQRLDFRKSWEFHEELVVNDALITLLNSRVCKDLKAFCGYPSLQILNNLPEKLSKMRVSLGKHSDPVSIIDELSCRQQRHGMNDSAGENTEPSEEILVHLRCSELDLKKLTSLPDSTTKVYISEVTDDDVRWVVQAAITLLRGTEIDGLYLPRSKLTATGVKGIGKGLFTAKLNDFELGISSPNIVDGENEDWSDVEAEDDGSDADSEDEAEDEVKYECSNVLTEMLAEKYDFVDVFFNNESRMDFTEFTDYIPEDLYDDFIKKLRDLKTTDSKDDC